MKNRPILLRYLYILAAFIGLSFAITLFNVLHASASGVGDAGTPTLLPATISTPGPGTETTPNTSNPHSAGNCLTCHGNENLQGKLPNGEIVSLYVVPIVHTGSFHNKPEGSCLYCHQDQKEYPHKGSTFQSCTVCHWQIAGNEPKNGQLIFDLPYQDARAISLSVNDACHNCHKGQFEEVKDSDHTRILNEGNRYAPVCIDCHKGHDITTVDRLAAAQICSKCHLA
jgi:hypothetical protein